MNIKISSFNVSFVVGQQNKIFGSEANFIKNTIQREKGNIKTIFINRINFIKKYIDDKKFGMLSIQELNNTKIDAQYIINKLKKINKSLEFYLDNIEVSFGNPTLMIIYNKDIYGSIVHKHICESYVPEIDNVYVKYKSDAGKYLNPIKTNSIQNLIGRPIQFLITKKDEKYYLMINIHGCNFKKYIIKYNKDTFYINKNRSKVNIKKNEIKFGRNINSDDYEIFVKTNKSLYKFYNTIIQNRLNEFLKIKKISKNIKFHKIIFTGDTNDHTNSLSDLKLKINNQNIILSYKGTPPKSCCYYKSYNIKTKTKKIQPYMSTADKILTNYENQSIIKIVRNQTKKYTIKNKTKKLPFISDHYAVEVYVNHI